MQNVFISDPILQIAEHFAAVPAYQNNRATCKATNKKKYRVLDT